jgi:hypothetical protein
LRHAREIAASLLRDSLEVRVQSEALRGARLGSVCHAAIEVTSGLSPTQGKAMKKRRRELFETQLGEIREELLRLGVRGRTRPANLAPSVVSDQAVTPTELTAAAYELAGYAVATLALGRNIPTEVVLEEYAKYDLGRCSPSDLETIWAVGSLAAERSRDDGCPGKSGLIDISVKMESDVAAATEVDESPENILRENWDDIARVARLLIEKGALSRDEIEGEVFEPDEGETCRKE